MVVGAHDFIAGQAADILDADPRIEIAARLNKIAGDK
jgi:hypothetical protein